MASRPCPTLPSPTPPYSDRLPIPGGWWPLNGVDTAYWGHCLPLQGAGTCLVETLRPANLPGEEGGIRPHAKALAPIGLHRYNTFDGKTPLIKEWALEATAEPR